MEKKVIKIRIVHLSYKDSQEGAAIAAERICSALNFENVSSKMLVQIKFTELEYVQSIEKNNIDKFFIKIRMFLDKSSRLLFLKKKADYFTFPFVGYDVSKLDVIKNSDIIHIHWIGRGFISFRNLKLLSKLEKPIVWTLHDSWLYTGGCHLTGDCTGYKDECNNCYKTRYKGISNIIINVKKKILKSMNLTIIAPSDWSLNKAKDSSLLNNINGVVIPNCVSTEIFKPLEIIEIKKSFGIESDEKIILFFMSNDTKKGVEYISKALKKFSKINNYKFLAFGDENVNKEWFKDLEVTCLGRINSLEKMCQIYNIADVYISASLEESFGQTYIEAMASGTPCVAFDNSGPCDIISHKEDGYLAKYRDIDDLSEGITYCLKNTKKLGENAIKKINNKFSYQAVAIKHKILYESILKRRLDENKS